MRNRQIKDCVGCRNPESFYKTHDFSCPTGSLPLTLLEMTVTASGM